MTTLSIGFDVPFHEALRAAAQRGVVLPDVYYGKLQGVARQLAFSIAGVAAYDQLQAVRDSLAEAMAQGKSFGEWKKEQAQKALGLPKHRLETIWRTNLQGNYMRGKWEQFVESKETFGFLEFDAVNDARVRESHLAHDGVIRPVDDPFWETHSPLLGYNCRCSLVQRTREEARARTGRNINGKPTGLDKTPTLPSGEPALPDPGWSFNPFADRLDIIKDQIKDRELAVGPGDKLAGALKSAKVKRWRDDVAGQWHDVSFNNSPEWITRSFIGLESPAVTYDESIGAMCIWDDSINMGAFGKDLKGQSVWRHEFGHWIDGQIGKANKKRGFWFRSQGKDFIKAMQADAKLARKKAGIAEINKPLPDSVKNARERLESVYLKEREKVTALGGNPDKLEKYLDDKFKKVGISAKQALDALVEDMPSMFHGRPMSDGRVSRALVKVAVSLEKGDAKGFWSALTNGEFYAYKEMIGGSAHKVSDLIGSATINDVLGIRKAGIGHTGDYYAKHGYNAGTECFADLTALFGHGSPFWSAVAERLAPNMSALFKTIMDEIDG